jgi:hypothetical protein
MGGMATCGSGPVIGGHYDPQCSGDDAVTPTPEQSMGETGIQIIVVNIRAFATA